MNSITLLHTQSFMVFRFNPKNYKDALGKLDIRKVAYLLARDMLANGCVIQDEPLKCAIEDVIEARVYVHYGKKESASIYMGLK